MKVFVQIVNCDNGIYQTGMIDEPVSEGLEIANAVRHFCDTSIEWLSTTVVNEHTTKIGLIKGTNKIVSAIRI